MNRSCRGEFLITNEVLYEIINDKPLIDLVFSNMIVVDARSDYMHNGVVYRAYSELFFNPCSINAMAPFYNFSIHCQDVTTQGDEEMMFMFEVMFGMESRKESIVTAHATYTEEQLRK